MGIVYIGHVRPDTFCKRYRAYVHIYVIKLMTLLTIKPVAVLRGARGTIAPPHADVSPPPQTNMLHTQKG